MFDIIHKMSLQGLIRVAGALFIWSFPQIVFVWQFVASLRGFSFCQFMRLAEGCGMGCCYQILMCGWAHDGAKNFWVIYLKMFMYLFVIFAHGV